MCLLSSNANLVQDVSTSPGISDHDAVLFNINARPVRASKPPHKVYSYKKTNIEGLKSDLNDANREFFERHPEYHSVEENWSFFKDKLTTAMNKNIPHKMTKARHNLPWVTRGIKRMMRKRDRLYKKAKKSGKEQHWAEYRRERNNTTKEIRKAHNKYLNEIVGEALTSNPKTFWSYLKTTKTENIGIPTLKSGQNICVSDKDKAEALNAQFKSVFTKDDNITPDPGPSPYEQIPNLDIGENGVMKQLKALNTKKAGGPDELSARILHDTAEDITSMLTYIFQQSFDTGTTPSDWTNALVSAIYKKGAKMTPANYRPISLTCLCCKIMEHIVLSHINKHLAANNILIDLQHGFRGRLSCETQLITSLHDWAISMNKTKQVDVLLLDFSKAFDVVSHRKLLMKLEYYGINNKTLGWIEAFLRNRTQSVSIYGTKSDPVEVTSGVPQGSVLGPMLFLLYINDISSNITSQMRLFADDSILYREINSPDDHRILQEDLDKLIIWAKTWQMSFNVSKCHLLSITRKRSPSTYNYHMDGEIVAKVPSSPYLGLTIDDQFRWNEHCDKTVSKANQTLGVITRALGPCSNKVKNMAYHSLVRPKVEYASTAWSPCTDRNVKRVEQVQRRAARFVCGDYRRTTSVTGLIDNLGWISLETRRLLAQATMFYKIAMGLVAISFPPEVKPMSSDSATREATENSMRYHRISSKNLMYGYSFYPRTIRVWNQLPTAVVEKPTVVSFQAAALPVLCTMRPPAMMRRL